jgi:hypothetical protein
MGDRDRGVGERPRGEGEREGTGERALGSLVRVDGGFADILIEKGTRWCGFVFSCGVLKIANEKTFEMRSIT